MKKKELFFNNIYDLIKGAQLSNIWTVAALLEIKRKYRRSIIGSMWITLNLVVLIGGMAVVFGALFGQPLETYIPYVAAGMIHWALIAALINEGTEYLIASKPLILQYNLPLSVHCYHHIFKNLLNFCHTVLVLVLVILIMPVEITFNTLMYPIGVLFIFVNGLWVALLMGSLSLKYRDLPMLTMNIIQACFFITPIFWQAESLKTKMYIAYFNPFYHFLEITREPILGRMPNWESYAIVGVITMVGCLVSVIYWSRNRHLVPYYL